MCNDTGTNDELRIAIQESISEGQIFKSMAEVYRTIGLELLGIHDLNGGKQCDTARKIVEQYARFEPVTSNGRSVRCEEIFEHPHYIEKTDGRGKNGFYIDRLVPLLLRYLHDKEGYECTTSVKKLAVALGIVKPNYSYFPKLEGFFENLDQSLLIPDDYYKQFYNRSKAELEPKIIGTLDRLKKEGVLNYERRYLIKPIGQKYNLSDDDDFCIIKEAEKVVVEQMGAPNKRSVYLRRQGEIFERNVIVYIHETHNQDWEFCAPVLQLDFHHYSIDRYISEKCPDIFENYETIATEVRKQFAQAIRRKTQLDYERTNRELDKLAEEILEQLKLDETICLFYDGDDLKELAMTLQLNNSSNILLGNERPEFFVNGI